MSERIILGEMLRGTEHDNYELLVRPLLDVIIERYRSSIIAIVLAGSISRGEATIRDGRLLSDYDYRVVTRSANPWIRYRIKKLGRRYAKSLPFRIQLHVVTFRDFLWRKSQQSYDAKNTGKVVFGNKGILDAIEIDRPDEIPHSAGLRLLFTVATYLIWAMQRPELVSYRVAKSYLAIGEAYLIFSGRHKSTCRERLLEITNNCKLPIIPNFVSKFVACSMFKLNQNDELAGLNAWTAVCDMLSALNYFSALLLHEREPLDDKFELLTRKVCTPQHVLIYVKLIIIRHLISRRHAS